MGLFDWLHQKGQAKREEIVEGCDFNGMFFKKFPSSPGRSWVIGAARR